MRHKVMDPLTDEELIARVTGGDTRAYEQLVLRYQDAIARFIWRLVPVNEDREEVCQDVFIKAYLNLGRFRFDAKFSTWLYSIAYRTAVSAGRKKRIDHEEFDDGRAVHDGFQQDVEDAEIARLLHAEIAQLNLEERGMVTLFHLNGCGIEEIGEILSKPAGTIKNALFRIRKKLKDRLEPQLNEAWKEL